MFAAITNRFLVIFFLVSFSTLTLSAQEYLEFLTDETLTFQEIVDKAEAHFDIKGRGKHSGYKQFQRWKYFANRNLDDQGKVISERKTAKAYKAFLDQSPKKSSTSLLNPWMEKGPLSATNTSTWSSHIGRVTNIAIDPNDDNHMVITSPGGGVWKTTDEGSSWTPLYDFEGSLYVNSALISHGNSDHYFVGGWGIRRSIDGGLTWSNVSGTSGAIYSMKMHPTDSNILIACSSNGRVYRSTDGGDNWTGNILTNTYLYDIEFKPNNPDSVYVSGRSGLFFISADNAVSFDTISGPWASRSIMMAVTPDDPDYLYVLQEFGGGFGGLFLSTDGGATFTTQSDNSGNDTNIMGYNLNQGGGQAPRDMDVIVSPTNKDEVHVAGVMTFKSSDAGVTWAQTTHWVVYNALPFVHADIDQLIYHGNKIYVASDGGVFISEDQGASFLDKTTGLGLRQFYRIGATAAEQGRVAGGSQDNGTGVLKSGVWYDFMGADGMEPIIFNEDQDIIVGSIQYGALYKSINGGVTASGIAGQNSSNGEWVTPLEKDPVQTNTIYQGKRHLYKSTGGGVGWETISDITPPGNTNIDEVCLAPSNNQVIYISYSAKLYKTEDGGINWSDVTPSNASGGFINYINVDPKDADHVIITLSSGVRILESTDGGTSWVQIKYNLPALGCNSIVFDGGDYNGMYVSMNRGVYFKNDTTTTTWTLLGTDLPDVQVTELEIVGNKLYAATYGRGLWELDIDGASCSLLPNMTMDSCISQSTPDSLDDAFTFSINPSGFGLSGTYSISGDVTINNIAYGNPYLFDNGGPGFLKANGAVSIVITDDSDGSCARILDIDPEADVNCYNNNFCHSAEEITGPGVYSAPGPSNGHGASTQNRHANWYSFIPPNDGTISIETCGSGEDTNLWFYKGDCDNLSFVAANDDACEMFPGGSAYASQLNDIAVTGGQLYYIEWDSRWSANPFDFLIEYTEECVDYIYADVSNMDTVRLRAASLVEINGSSDGLMNLSSPGKVNVDGSFNLESSGTLNALNDTCDVNVYTDWMVLGGAGTTITDNGFVDVLLTVPADRTLNIVDIDVYLNIQHPDASELRVSIINPAGNAVVIWDNLCAGESDIHFFVDDDALSKDICGSSWQEGKRQYNDGVIPELPFGVLYGVSSVGVWKIRIEDNNSGNVGMVKEVGIVFRG